MFLPFRKPQKMTSRASLALVMLGVTAPACAASRTSVFEDARSGAVQAGIAIMAYGDRMAARDMPTIQATAFALSGLIGLIGLWLLVRRGHRDTLQLDVIYAGAGPAAAGPADAGTPAEAESDRPVRLLEAIAAAKAQVAISEAEKKHRR